MIGSTGKANGCRPLTGVNHSIHGYRGDWYEDGPCQWELHRLEVESPLLNLTLRAFLSHPTYCIRLERRLATGGHDRLKRQIRCSPTARYVLPRIGQVY